MKVMSLEVYEALKKLKSALCPDGEYSICRSDDKKMQIWDVIYIGTILDSLDEQIAAYEIDQALNDTLRAGGVSVAEVME